MISGLPWPDDQTVRLVLFQGHHLVKDNAGQTQNLIFKYEGPALNVTSQVSINCSDIAHNATAGLSIQCGDVGGDCNAGNVINCGDIGSDCRAEGRISQK